MGTYTGQDKRLKYLFENGGGGGTTVIANPQGEPTDDLETIQIGNTVYDIIGGGSGEGQLETYHANWTATATTGYQGALTDSISLPTGKYIAIAHSPYSTQSGDMLYTLTANGTAIDGGGKSVYSNINYGDISFYFELNNTASVALAAGTALTNIRWDSQYLDRGGLDIIKLDSIVGIEIASCYSLEEQQIGCWIDGKPLYSRVFDLGSDIVVPNNAWYGNIVSISNIDKIANCYGMYSGGTYYPLMAYHTGNEVNVLACRQNAGASVRYLAIQYTKTTDVAGSGKWTPSGTISKHYSTSEQVIGTYLGQTLYEKTAEFGAISANTNNYLVTMGMTNVDKVIDIRAVAFTGNSSFVLPFPLLQSASTFAEYGMNMQGYDKSTDKIRLDTGSNRSVSGGHITIQYTKTT